MKSASSAPPSTVLFPVQEPLPKYVQPGPILRPPHLPFRRISSPPPSTSLMYRQSVVSVASFDSLPEEGSSLNPIGKGDMFSISVESPRRRRRPDVKLVDETRETKRRKVIQEFSETEKAYVDGLELIYSHFLTPIIASLDTPTPLLDRSSLPSVFSNFIDIWNLHRSFYSSLSSLLSDSINPPPPLSPVLLSHFPYLSLYTPFIISFPISISTLITLTTPSTAAQPNPLFNAPFAKFLSIQESDPRCGKLKLRDWLLTIIQRCPRYLLLLKDLITCTNFRDSEYDQLKSVHALVSKITTSLNTSLQTHTQTLSLLSLQRFTSNLPRGLQLVSPGRILLKRGPLLMLERGSQPRRREFLLFSDCLLWIAHEDAEKAWNLNLNWGDWGIGWSGSKEVPVPKSGSTTRSRCKSEAELSAISKKDEVDDIGSESSVGLRLMTPSKYTSPSRNMVRRSYHPPSNSSMPKRATNANGGADEQRWIFKGKVGLVDLDVIAGVSVGIEEEEESNWKFEVLSPEGSFVLFTETEQRRDDWISSIRQAKTQLLVSLGATHPHTTLRSSASTTHLRKSLQALPFMPDDERLGTLREGAMLGFSSRMEGDEDGGDGNPHRFSRIPFLGIEIKGQGKNGDKVGVLPERRRKVDHWVPAIWIPDERSGTCMRCGEPFGWRRRRHHCRLCGRCICAGCSGKTFFISDSNEKETDSISTFIRIKSKFTPARACDACYETVFPLIGPPTSPKPHPDQSDSDVALHQFDADTITSLRGLPMWVSMPSFPTTVVSTPEALMAIDQGPSRSPRRSSFVGQEDPRGARGRMKLRRLSLSSGSGVTRPRSLLESNGFDGGRSDDDISDRKGNGDPLQGRFDILNLLPEEGEGETEGEGEAVRQVVDFRQDRGEADDTLVLGDDHDYGHERTSPASPSPLSFSFNPRENTKRLTSYQLPPPPEPRKENTARRSKRFSLPAVAMQPTNVTVHASVVVGIDNGADGDWSSGDRLAMDDSRMGKRDIGIGKRFSLVTPMGGGVVGRSEEKTKEGMAGEEGDRVGGAGLGGPGTVVRRLNELLRRE